MRTAKDIVNDYRKRGYSDKRLQTLAHGRPDPIKSEILEYVAQHPQEPLESPEEDILASLEVEQPAEDAIPEMGEVAESEIDVESELKETSAETQPTEMEEVTDDMILEEVADAKEEEKCEQQEPQALETIATEPEQAEMPDVIHQDALVGLAFEEDDTEVAESDNNEMAEAQAEQKYETVVGVDKREIKLTSIGIEHLSPEEYFNLRKEPMTVPDEVIDLREEFAVAESAQGAGEVWPSVGQVESAEDKIKISKNRAVNRTLEVIRNTLGDEAITILDEDSNVISLNPPYGEGDEEMEHAGGSSILMVNEESGLIKFPTEVVESYDMIRAAHAEDEADSLDEEVALRAEAELQTLRDFVNELEASVKKNETEIATLETSLAERESMIQNQIEEIELLRIEAPAAAASVEAEKKYQEAEKALSDSREKMTDIERELNIMKSETLANLMKDKEDLQDMLEKEVVEKTSLEDSLVSTKRRSGVGFTMAVAASLLAITMPVVNWIHSGRTNAEFNIAKSKYEAQIADATAKARSFENDKIALAAEIEVLNRKRSMDHARFMEQRAEITASLQKEKAELAKQLRERELQVAQLSQVIGGQQSRRGPAAPTPRAVASANRTLGNTGSSSTTATMHAAADGAIHRNEVRGIEQWRARYGRDGASAEATQAAEKVAVVKKGDGLSHVLWRAYGKSDKALLDAVIKMNDIKINRHGNPIIYPGQELRLPADDTFGSSASAR